MTVLEIGDTIQCADSDDMVNTMHELQRGGVETDFLFELDGQKGLWLKVTGLERTEQAQSTGGDGGLIMSYKKRCGEQLLTYQGETRTLEEWSRRVGVSARGLEQRIARGWTPEEVIETPPRVCRSRKKSCSGCSHWRQYSGMDAAGCHYFFDTGELRSAPEEKCERRRAIRLTEKM